ncbi:MAG TPA: ribulose-phosphate 3-epimerase, partial [Pirellulales bacterium]|nr:ribulose-phosphate 3-epimerase [Pirellulales bacterium]
EPERYAEAFFQAGADAITFHVEAASDSRGLLQELRRMGAVAGLAYNPATPLSAIEHCLDVCDLVLTMSVDPGFGGQEFQSVALEKLSQLRGRVGSNVMLEIDGGVNDHTIARCAEAGAHLMVVGSAIFAHPDYSQSIARLTCLAGNPRRTR